MGLKQIFKTLTFAACASQSECVSCHTQGPNKCDSCKRGYKINSLFTECLRKYILLVNICTLRVVYFINVNFLSVCSNLIFITDEIDFM